MKFSRIRKYMATALAAAALGSGLAMAGTPQQVGINPGVSALGAATLTNDTPQTVRLLRKIAFTKVQPQGGTNFFTVTISRVSSVNDGLSTNVFVTTNVVATITSAVAATTATFQETNTASFFFYNDLTKFSGVGTGSFEAVQTHEVLP